jgi:hypothetical protein
VLLAQAAQIASKFLSMMQSFNEFVSLVPLREMVCLLNMMDMQLEDRYIFNLCTYLG